MPDRHVPVRPNLRFLKNQAKDLLRDIRAGSAAALSEFRRNHPGDVAPESAKLADAQLALARSYGVSSWPRIVVACQMIHAIWSDDPATVRDLVRANPALLHEDARGVKGNWGPPMSYAANLGRIRIIRLLRDLGAEDVDFAFDRACLQGELETARLLQTMGATPQPGSVMGPCETLSPEGLAFLIGCGAPLADEHGNPQAPAAMLLEGYARHPAGKHRCLDILEEHGTVLPDTPAMALHRGRIDRLERHLARDPSLLWRTFSHEEIYPPSLGCHADHSQALHGTPLDGATLLHMAIDFDEEEILRWLLAKGAPVDARAAMDVDGFGGHTPLFSTVVVQPHRLRRTGAIAGLLLDRGADPAVRASLRKQLRGVDDESLHEYRDVTAAEWGRRFHDQSFVSQPALRLIDSRSR